MISKGFSRALAGVVLVSTLVLTACGGSSYSNKQAKSAPVRKSYKPVTSENSTSADTRWLPNPHNSIPVVVNEPVKKMIGKFTGQWKGSFDKWVGRIGLYGPTIEKVLREEGVPEDLIYLSMIESGFNLKAKSHASAVGPWQFIQSTGKMYGLKNDLFQDDRSNLIQATRAAARHLKDLHNEFGDWYLAFAAYNAGSGGVRSAMRRAGSSDYWKLTHTRYMHPETKEYVPKILAALHIVKNYKDYGYTSRDFALPLQYDAAVVNDAADIGALASASGASVADLQELNPALASGITRPNSNTIVYLPKGKKSDFLRNFPAIPESRRVSPLIHPVRGNESLRDIASYYGIEADRIAKANNLKGDDLKPGQEIKIPVNKTVLATLASKPLSSGRSSSGGTTQITHKVKKGETLARVAKKYGTSTAQIAKWNKLGKKTALHAGQNLKIYRSKGATKSVAYNPRPFYASGLSSHTSEPTMLYAQADDENNTAETPVNADEVESHESLSGVAHLIFLEEANTDDIGADAESSDSETFTTSEDDGMATDEPQDISGIIQTAAADDGTNQDSVDAEFPGFVKTGEDNPAPTAPVALAPETVSPKAAPESQKTQFHVVKSGENLATIAAKYKVSVASLKTWNNLTNDKIRPQQKLRLQKSNTATATAKSIGSSQDSYVWHKIRSGENLWVLAKKYRVSVSDIKKWNNLNGNDVRADQKLKIFASTN